MSAFALDSPTSNGFSFPPLTKMPGSSASTDAGDDDEDLSFESPKEEAAYYRDKYRGALDILEETRAELDEFQLSSRELEQELERELEATEARQTELRDKITRLESEKEEFKTKFFNLQKMHTSTVTAMQREMDNLRSERDKTLVALRDLEMGNDELERSERVALSSLLDLESKYNRAIEEKTLLEQELCQKQEVEEECQRAKDELRDANNEIGILRDQLARAVIPTPPPSTGPMSPMPKSHSRAGSRADSRSQAVSPTPTDHSVRSEHSVDRERPRSDRSTTVTPRQFRGAGASTAASPRIPRSVSAAVSPKRPGSANTPTSGIPSLSRSTTARNLASVTATPPANAVPRRLPPVRQTKATQLLTNLQARFKSADDKISSTMPDKGRPRRRVGAAPPPLGPKRTTTSSTPTAAGSASGTASASGSTAGNAASHARVAALAKSTMSTPAMDRTNRESVLSPGWHIVSPSEAKETPTPAMMQPFAARERDDPGSPLERSTRHATHRSRGHLPPRPSIPSPLAPALAKSTKGRYRLTSSTMASASTRFANATANAVSALSSVSSASSSTTSLHSQATSASARSAASGTSAPHSNRTSASSSSLKSAPSRPPLLISTSRPPSRGHTHSRSVSRTGALSPTFIPGPPRRASLSSSSLLDLPSRLDLDLPSPTSASSTVSGVSASGSTVSAASGASATSASSRATSRPPSRIDPDRTFTERDRDRDRDRPRGTQGYGPRAKVSSSAIPSEPAPTKRAPRRSSLGVAEINLPPSGIPAPVSAPRQLVGRANSLAASTSRVPPVPRIPTHLKRAKSPI